MPVLTRKEFLAELKTHRANISLQNAKKMANALKVAGVPAKGGDIDNILADAKKAAEALPNPNDSTGVMSDWFSKQGTVSKSGSTKTGNAKSGTSKNGEDEKRTMVNLDLYMTVAALIGAILQATEEQVMAVYEWFNAFSEKPVSIPGVLADAKTQARKVLVELSVRGVTHSGILKETWTQLDAPAAPPTKPNPITTPTKTEAHETVGLTWTPSSTPGAETRIRRTIEGKPEENLGKTSRNVFAETGLENGKKVMYTLTAEVNNVESDPVMIEALPKAPDAKPPKKNGDAINFGKMLGGNKRAAQLILIGLAVLAGIVFAVNLSSPIGIAALIVAGIALFIAFKIGESAETKEAKS